MSNLGAIYTPPDIAEFLANWAIRNTDDKVLDLGVGEGAFAFAAHHKLVALGGDSERAANQIYGTEIDQDAYDRFERVSKLSFPKITHQDFFDASFPLVDVIIGNPPYVRRREISAKKTKRIREKVLALYHDIKSDDLSQLTDLYVYFLLQASQSLKENGRLAVIVADSWLNARYGYILKHFLLNNFVIERIINFDRPIFSNVQVKPVLLFATKQCKATKPAHTAFTRVMNGLSINQLSDLFQEPEPVKQDVKTILVSTKKLASDSPWGVHFKISKIDNLLANNNWFVPLQKIAKTRIGIQTLAKDFFALPPEYIEDHGIEADYVTPFAYSISQFKKNVIDENSDPNLYIFFCSKTKDELNGSQALVHILDGESKELIVRGRGETVIGYQNKKRIQNANRPHWYDIKTNFERRGCAPILIPRLIYGKYFAIWNKAKYVPGGAIIEIIPTGNQESNARNIQLLLAVFNSTLMEVLIRGNAQLYGGGTYTVSLSRLKQLLVPDITKLNKAQQNALIAAYQSFLIKGSRDEIDIIIWEYFELDATLFYKAAEDLRTLSLGAKK